MTITIRDVAAIGLFAVVGKAMLSNLDFEKELGFYGAYHQEPHNQAIHFVFIPLIWWSICVWMCYLPVSDLAVDVGGSKRHPVTYGTIMLAMYCAYYCTLDLFTGSIFSGVLVLMYLQASAAVQQEVKARAKGKNSTGRRSWSRIAFIVHTIGWVMQIGPGHGFYEGVKPALVDSLGQALGVAPLFAFLEGIWYVGLAADLKERVALLVEENRAEMCAAGASYPWCG